MAVNRDVHRDKSILESNLVGAIALLLASAGVIGFIVVELTIAQSRPGNISGFPVFLGFQFAAIGIGLVARNSLLGRIVIVLSGVATFLSFMYALS